MNFPLDRNLVVKGGIPKTRTTTLFVEFSRAGNAVLTLDYEDREIDGVVYPAIYPIFMEEVLKDPTEYSFARRVFGQWKYWNDINQNTKLRERFDQWREEVDVKRKSEAYQQLVDIAQSGDYRAVSAILKDPWATNKNPEDKRKTRVKARETAEKAYQTSGIQSDLQRLRDEGLIN